MSLASGARLGPYEIVAPLGVGGMGQVFKGRDTRLNRTVAIKVIAAGAASTPEWSARFEREAPAVAALDHPHICGIFDVGDAGGTPFLVMPLLDGETLASRLEGGRVPLDETIRIARDIASAVAAAHEHGIVHRDLKPANIMLTRNGAKLLDFGLAKLTEPSPVSISSSSRLDTTGHGTARGTILGTLHYMSPEQVEGRQVDSRTDVWALGVVIYEMTSGARPFEGDTPASLLSAILKDEPLPLMRRSGSTPPLLDRLLGRCLAKIPADRWRSAADLGEALGWIADGGSAVDARAVPSAGWRRILPLAVAGTAIAGAMALLPGWSAHRRETSPPSMQLALTIPPNLSFSSPPASVVAPQLATSPDGRHVVFAASPSGGQPMLWLRRLGDAQPQALAGTEGAIYPFWSPDSRSLGFFTQGRLKVIDLAGGPARTLSDSPLDSRGGSWSPNGTILFAPTANGGLSRVPAAGGPAVAATELDGGREENSHRFPSFLPDGEHFVYVTRGIRPDNWGVSLGTLGSTKGTALGVRTDWSAQGLAPESLFFSQAGTLMRQPFDLARLTITGEAVPIARGIGGTTTGYAAFSASAAGTLAYAPALVLPGQLRWFSRSGVAENTVGVADEYLDFELSPDGRTVAMSRVQTARTRRMSGCSTSRAAS